MRKIYAAMATAAAAAGLILAVSSSAQAATAATTTVRGVYFDYANCVAMGDAGVARGTWTTYTCQLVPNQNRTVYYLMA
jgi:hypothetical protein